MSRRIVILAAATFPMLIAACGEYTVRPGEVEKGQLLGGTGIQGPFEIALANPGEPTVTSQTGTGGACMVTQDPRTPRPCQTDADCRVEPYTDENGRKHVPHLSAYGYCLAYSNKALSSTKSCWIKPSESYCLKRVGPGKHLISATSEYQARQYLGMHTQLTWRVVGCVNGNDDESTDNANDKGKPPCGEANPKPGERLELAGKEKPEITSVPPLPPPLHPPSK
jgi:hypothetical protein